MELKEQVGKMDSVIRCLCHYKHDGGKGRESEVILKQAGIAVDEV